VTEAIDPRYSRFWHTIAFAGAHPDVSQGSKLVVSKREGDGTWLLGTRHPGVMPVETDQGEGRPSRWNTLCALRVLKWSSQQTGAELH
jgi:hypothetical protein